MLEGKLDLHLLQNGYRGDERVLSSGVKRPGLETTSNHPPPCSFEYNTVFELCMASWDAEGRISRLRG